MEKAVKREKGIEWWMYFALAVILLTGLTVGLVYTRLGTLGLVIYYLGPLTIVVTSIIGIIIGLIYSIKHKPFFKAMRVVVFLVLIAGCFVNSIFGKYPSYYDDKPSEVNFILPLDTTIYVAWGGRELNQNYHAYAPDQCWAYDLLLLKDGKTYDGDSSELTSYYCYGLPILAPATGEVIKTFDDAKEAQIGTMGDALNPLGNHVVIKVSEGEYLFICHIKPGTIKVEKGEQVEQGQILAQVGNSGHTSEPHIHMHLQSTDQLGFGEGIPMPFSNYVLEDGTKVKKGIPTGGFGEEGEFLGQSIRNAY